MITNTTMNPNQSIQQGLASTPATAVETAKPLGATAEKKSILSRIASVSSGIFGKIKRVIPFVNSAEPVEQIPANSTETVTNGVLPNYQPVTSNELLKNSQLNGLVNNDTLVYQSPRAIPTSGSVRGVAVTRKAPDLNKDIFAHLSNTTEDLTSSTSTKTATQTLTLNGLTSARLSVYPANSTPQARVLPRTAKSTDYNFEYRDPQEAKPLTFPETNLSKRFNRPSQLPVARPAVQATNPQLLKSVEHTNAVQAPMFTPATTVTAVNPTPKKQQMDALEDVNNYVAQMDKQYYADLAERRSRGVLKNLSLWATRIKEDLITAVAPNYVMRKAYRAAEASLAPKVAPTSAPAQSVVPKYAANQPVTVKPSFLSRLKAGYENFKESFSRPVRKLVTATALAGAVLGLNAPEQETSKTSPTAQTSLAYAAKHLATPATTYKVVQTPVPVVKVPSATPTSARPTAHQTSLLKDQSPQDQRVAEIASQLEMVGLAKYFKTGRSTNKVLDKSTYSTLGSL